MKKFPQIILNWHSGWSRTGWDFFLPALTQEKLTNQIGVVSNERLERYDNQPYGLAWEILVSNLYPEGHPYNWPTIGLYE